MSDYISREAAISWLEDMQCKHPRKADAFGAAKVHFKHLPAADVRPVVRGKWISCGYSGARCDQCGNQCHEFFDQNFCPNCGADMREEV
mgnify:CR=1 FL=1